MLKNIQYYLKLTAITRNVFNWVNYNLFVCWVIVKHFLFTIYITYDSLKPVFKSIGPISLSYNNILLFERTSETSDILLGYLGVTKTVSQKKLGSLIQTHTNLFWADFDNMKNLKGLNRVETVQNSSYSE